MTELHPFGPSSHAPLDDPAEMPECYPIKGNDDSMLYHRPDSMNYGATVAEVWFTSPSAAEAAGFSLSNTHPKNSSSADFEPGGSGHPCSASQVSAIVAGNAGGEAAGAASAAGGEAAGGASAAADAAESAVADAKGAAGSAADKAKGGLGKAAALGGAGVAGAAAAGVAGLGGAKDAAAGMAGSAKDAVSGAAGLGGAKDAAAGMADSAKDAVSGAAGLGGAKDAAAGMAGSAKDAVSGAADLGGAKDAAAGMAGSAKGAVAGAAGAAAGVAGMAAASGSDAAAATSESAASASDASVSAGDDADHPFGPGSHVPLSNVHDMPECHPIKGNADSMKYHRPDSSGYAETKAEVWFMSPAAAEAAGFVLAGSHPQGSSSADFEPGSSGHPCTAEQLRGMGLGSLLVGGAAAGAVASTLMSSGSASSSGSADIDADGTAAEVETTVVKDAEVTQPEAERVVYRASDTPTDDVDLEVDVDAKGKGISGKTAAAAAGGAAIVGGLAAAAASKGDDIDVAKPKVNKPKVNKPKVEKPKVEKPKVETTRAAKASKTTKATTSRASSSVKETTRMTTDKVAATGGGSVGGKVPTAKGGFGGGWWKWLLPLLLLAALILFLLWACGGDDDATPVANTAAVPTATAVPPTATAVPPTATAVPEPTATAEPEPTPEPDPTATPEPAAAAYVACADVLGTLEDNGFTILATAANLAGFEDELAGEDPLTIFAPTDAAFEAVPEDTLNAALGDQQLLASIISYHVVPGAVTSGDLSDTGVATVNGSNVAVRLDLDSPRVNNAGVTTVDIEAGDCVVHGIDSILTPPVLLSSLGFTSLNDVVSGGTISFEPGTATLTAADSATLAAICNLVANESSARSLPPINWESTGDAEIDAARAGAIEAALADCGPPVFNYNAILGDYEAPAAEEPVEDTPAPEFTG